MTDSTGTERSTIPAQRHPADFTEAAIEQVRLSDLAAFTLAAAGMVRANDLARLEADWAVAS